MNNCGAEQEAERSRGSRRLLAYRRRRDSAGPAAYPAPERTFAAYPTRWLDGGDRVVRAPGASDSLDVLLAMPLTHHAPGRRVTDAGLLRAAFALLPCSVEDLDRFWSQSGVDHGVGRATLAWMLKYDLLRGPDDDRRIGGLETP